MAIQDAREQPRPQPGGPSREDGDPPSQLLSPLSTLLLSPLSSLDLSAEPLSPNTTAAIKVLRERHFPHSATDRGAAAEHDSSAADASGAVTAPLSSL